MHIKAKPLHFFDAKKIKIVRDQEKSLWCILHSKKIFLFCCVRSQASEFLSINFLILK